MFSYTEGLIIVAIATACILSSADGESCDMSNCSPCPQPLNSLAYCESQKAKFIPKASICSCCDQCSPYLNLLDKCNPPTVDPFPKANGGVVRIARECGHGLICKPSGVCRLDK